MLAEYYNYKEPRAQAVATISICKNVLHVARSKNILKDIGMTVPKTIETRCRDGSVQARHVIQRLHK